MNGNRKEAFLAAVFLSVAICTFISLNVAHNERKQSKQGCVSSCVTTDNSLNAIETLIWCDSVGKHEPNDSIVVEVLNKVGIQHPHIVYAQMRLESGNYKSGLAKSNENLFGMKHPNVRATLSIGSKNGYACYRNWCYGVLDYALWQRVYARDLTEDEYLEMLSEYAEDEEYIEKVKRIAKSVGNK